MAHRDWFRKKDSKLQDIPQKAERRQMAIITQNLYSAGFATLLRK